MVLHGCRDLHGKWKWRSGHPIRLGHFGGDVVNNDDASRLKMNNMASNKQAVRFNEIIFLLTMAGRSSDPLNKIFCR